jgi:transcriptional regulator with XRE-family HTH domain
MARTAPVPSADSGADLLRAHIKALDFSAHDAAEALQVSDATMSDWLNRVSRPRAKLRTRIRIWSGGDVPDASWESQDERDELAAFAKAAGR